MHTQTLQVSTAHPIRENSSNPFHLSVFQKAFQMSLGEFNQFMSLLCFPTHLQNENKTPYEACEVQEISTMLLSPDSVHDNHNSLFLGPLYQATFPLMGLVLAGPAPQNAILGLFPRSLLTLQDSRPSLNDSSLESSPKMLSWKRCPFPKALCYRVSFLYTGLFTEYVFLFRNNCPACPLA